MVAPIRGSTPDSSPQVICQRPDLQVGGRIAHFSGFWSRLPTEELVRGVLNEGYKIPFKKLPSYQGLRLTPLTGQYGPILLDEVDSLLGKGAIERVSESDAAHGYYSTYFLVPKKTGDMRPILNLKPINGQIQVRAFKMETLQTVMTAVQVGDWIASVDLKDAYFHVPIHPDHREYLRFRIQGRSYQYRVLPFGLSTSPRTFTKVLAPVIAYLRMCNIQAFPYLDDILFSAGSQQALTENMQFVVRTLTQAGFIVNAAKSSLTPSQDMVFIGARFQTALDLVCLPLDRAQNISKVALTFAVGKEMTARQWLSLLGLMASTLVVTKHARIHMRPVQLFLHSKWKRDRQGLSHLIQVTPEVHVHIQWWENLENLLSGLPLSPPVTQAVITTDASSLGWGGVLGEEKGGGGSSLTVQGKWDRWQMAWHINKQELAAVQLTLHHFVHHLRGQSVLVRSDNMTTCAYINKYGGTRSRDLCLLALDLWEWCIHHNMTIKAVHVPGVDNVLADFLSRQTVDQREWGLHQHVANHLFYRWNRPNIDLFASVHNKKLGTFCTLYPSPVAYCQDAFSISWSNFSSGYAFPPIVLMPRVLRKVRQDRASLILIAPFWPRRAWYTWILQMLVDYPLELPDRADLLAQFRVLHPSPQCLKLVAWRISGVTSETNSFQRRLLTSLLHQGLSPQQQAIIQSGEYTCAGVINGVSVPILPL